MEMASLYLLGSRAYDRKVARFAFVNFNNQTYVKINELGVHKTSLSSTFVSCKCVVLQLFILIIAYSIDCRVIT